MKVAVKALTLSMALLLSTVSIPHPAYSEEEQADIAPIVSIENRDPLFSEFEGTVETIHDLGDKQAVRIQKEDDTQIDMIVTDHTVITNLVGLIPLADIKEGDAIIAYYVMPQITTMIYPPQMEASILVVTNEETPGLGLGNVYVNIFDENHLAIDGSLKLNISEETVIVDKDGNKYEGSLNGPVLLVYATIQTMSLPPQTPPNKIVVLTDMPVQEAQQDIPPMPALPDEPPQDMFDMSNLPNIPIFVNGSHVEGASAYMGENETMMVPLKAIAEAIGYDITWEGDTKQVRVGRAITMQIGVNAYNLGRMAPIELSAAPVIKDSITYVPSDFFTLILETTIQIDEGILNFQAVLED